jgi:hypothetical protein
MEGKPTLITWKKEGYNKAGVKCYYRAATTVVLIHETVTEQ